MSSNIIEITQEVIGSIEVTEEVVGDIEITAGGPQGPPGLTAYELAVALGYGGTLAQWLQMQRGFVILEMGQTIPPAGTPDDTIVFVKI